ncbi:Succinylglutamate desuccinylase / Aspartoacylase family protein [Halogranum rubrum]|uniref:Succinylglutamate desuccinylase / Aspartoacylase family protein n=1 Tax=Halogranum rubrum TaxID=553466 RepID=A0A1I4EFM7_9EURY|nr:succinylglutamate desuccinylase/aspartoacylase family protein [Halogranum rubrum]SFL03800.1 Succinylglutamate desuccinylase / Aspartoacylase family protein [Halogranum rubrum]
MTRNSSSPTVGRRAFLRGATALGIGLATLPALSSPVAAAGRTSYTIMSGTEHETDVFVVDSGRDGPTMMVVAGLHGDERAGYLAADTIAQWGVECGKLVVIPRSHVVAIEAGSRTYDGIDMNRVFPPLGGDCMHPLAQALWNEVVKHDPDYMFDLHSSRGIYQSGDGGVGQALFPTWTVPARYRGEKAARALNDYYDLSGDIAFQMGNTLDADRHMLMHRVAGMLDRPGFICETTEKADLDDQIKWHLFAVEHVMNQIGLPRGALADGDDDTVSASEPSGTDDPAFTAMNVELDDVWQQYSLSGHDDTPVVIAKPLTIVGDDPCHPRLRRVTASDFECRIEEWANENGRHYEEHSGVFALEPGVHTLADGTKVEAGTVTADTDKTVVRFDERFDYRPVVLTQAQTVSDSTPVVTRTRGPWTDGFEVYLQMEEAKTGEHHDPEQVGWIAIERGTGTIGDRLFEAGVEKGVRSSWHRIEFERTYDNPVFVAGVQSLNDSQPCGLRYRNLTSSSVDVFVEEEDSADTDRTHGEEDVGYLVIEG